MKTKYILHGGAAQDFNAQNDKFFEEILKDTPDNPKILLVYFAKELDRIPKNKEEDIAQFTNNRGDKNLSFDVAEEKNFIEQVLRSDVIYLHGGTTVKLLDSLKKFSNLKELFKGKTVAGESAGANVLCKYCYSQSGGGVFKGLGIFPIKIICHYEGKYKKELEDIPEEMDILTLPNYQYKVFNLT